MKPTIVTILSLFLATTLSASEIYLLKASTEVEVYSSGKLVRTEILKPGTSIIVEDRNETKPTQKPTESDETIALDNWEVETKVDPITDAKSYIISTAGEYSNGRGNFGTKPYLVMRVTPKNGKLKGEIYFTSRFEFFDSDSDIQIRLDKEKPYTVAATASDSLTAIFLPNDTIKKLYGHEKMTIRATTANSQRTFIFNVSGLKTTIDKIKSKAL